MKDEVGRKKVFAAAATLKCDKNDFGEALAQQSIREAPPEAQEKMMEELRLAGCNIDHPGIVEKYCVDAAVKKHNRTSRHFVPARRRRSRRA